MPIPRRLLLTIVPVALVVAALALVAVRWADGQARASADAAAGSLARTHLGLLASELQKFRLLPLVLVEYPDVADAMATDARAPARLDATLELLAARTDAAAIYAIGRDGRTVAASNWRLPTSFVGRDYGFRPYFTRAMRDGASELFALGTVSGRPGLYLARRVDRGGRALGVVVVKVEFDRMEADWAASPGISLVTDAQGVILVTGLPAWRFRAVNALDAGTLADARRTLQFGPAPPARAPLRLDGADARVPTGARGAVRRFRVASLRAPLGGGRLLHLAPLGPPLAAARAQALLWLLGAVLVIGVAAGLGLRAAETRRMQRAARAALEIEVARRTAELREANARLRIESAERLEADRRYRTAREELAQANRLGSLGQITAGVAHEINQPVAAIRTFAENAATLLDRGAPGPARANLGHIVGLTDRIGTITAELRSFARRRTQATGAVATGSVLDGALLLIGESARGIVHVDADAATRRACVIGDRVRIEQVLVNLLQNALEAVATVAGPRILVSASSGDGAHAPTIRVADNGAGVADEVRDVLFTPFASTKPAGLGLGLAIARDIAREFGGDLSLEPSAIGAAFLLTLRRA